MNPTTYDFSKDWTPYWGERINVYHQKELKEVIDQIGANYKFTPTHTASADKFDSGTCNSSAVDKIHRFNNSPEYGIEKTNYLTLSNHNNRHFIFSFFFLNLRFRHEHQRWIDFKWYVITLKMTIQKY